MTADLILEIRDLQKGYGGLRPLRVKQLVLRPGQRVAIVGFDQQAAEMFVNLATGASTPDAGEVRVLGESTAAISDGNAWLASLDRFGILSDRAVLLDQLTVAQNLAVPLTLDIDPIPEDVLGQVTALATEVGIDAADLGRPVASVSSGARARVRLGRAVALNPHLLLAEHPTAAVAPEEIPAFAADLSRVARGRDLACLILTADQVFAAAAAEEILTLDPVTGGWRTRSLLDRLRGHLG